MPTREFLMTSTIAKTLAAAALLGVSGWASASTTAIDLFKTPGVAGSGGHAIVAGPCYCEQGADFSPILLLAPGTYDFGKVRDYWVQSGLTPDGGPDQPNLYLLFSPWEVAGTFPGDLPFLPTDAYPSSYALCDQDDAACNAGYMGAFKDTELILTVDPGQNAVEIGFIGPYAYTSPLPEASGYAMSMLGLALVGAASRRRPAGRRTR
jgi:hypothetical protein